MTGTWSQNQKQILRGQSSQSRTSSLNQNGSFLAISVITIIVISILFLIRPINASSTNHASTANNAHHISSSKQKQQQQQVWPLNKYAREALSKAEAKFQNMDKDDIIVDPNSNRDTENQKSIYIATEFLNHASPSSITGLGSEGLGVDDSYGDDRMVKVGRSLVDLVRLADAGGGDDDNNNDNDGSGSSEKVLSLGLQHIVEQCDILAKGDLKVPTTRFGKTEIDMPIATLGCMRFQQSWSNAIDNMDKIKPEVQQNLKEIFKYAISKLGMNHIETAQGYGTSQLQIGALLQELYAEKVTTREELIIQTKIGTANPKDFRRNLDQAFKLLQVEYLDLFSFHGVNLPYQYDLIFNNPNGEENLIDIVKEYQEKGLIRHIGFSTHAQPELIRKCIETDAFQYVNLHYHYFGSYTANGGGEGGDNLENIRLMKEKDMGVFIISAYDKGGRLYAPSKKLRSLTLPHLEPMLFGSMWLWAHQDMDEQNSPVHTFTVGAARASDLDEPAVAAYLFRTRKDEMLDKIKAVTKKLDDARIEALGEDWVKSWFEGVPNCLTEDDSYQLGQIVSFYNVVEAWGLLDYAKDRYAMMDQNRKKWNSKLSPKENIATMRSGWGYTPGITPEVDLDYTSLLSKVPEKNRERVLEAIEFAYKYCSKLSDACVDVPDEWETAYDMRPWCAFPERR